MSSPGFQRRIEGVKDHARPVKVSRGSRFVLMSDCHRGYGDEGDNFAPNEKIYFAALEHYFKNNFTYIELGDGDELWENRDYARIICRYSHIFWLLSQFYAKGRLYFIYGNHDIKKRKVRFVQKYLSSYYCGSEKKELPLFPDLLMEEGILLKDLLHERQILLLHGHQGELVNDTCYRLSRFLVRYFWKPLELLGIKNPFERDSSGCKRQEKPTALMEYAEEKKQILIAGHTHQSEHGAAGGYYYNTGCCVHPRCITAIEITDGVISLVKWSIQPDENMRLFVKREVLKTEGKQPSD